MVSEIKTFDPPQASSPSFDATLTVFNRHYADAIAEGFPAGKAETQAAIRTVEENARNVAAVLGRK
jgi:hypothetical protein